MAAPVRFSLISFEPVASSFTTVGANRAEAAAVLRLAKRSTRPVSRSEIVRLKRFLSWLLV